MAIDDPVPDTARAIQHDPDRTWPASVVLQVTWHIDGINRVRTAIISADQFFGRGEFGAPLPGEGIINMIEHMRRAGPPPLPRKSGPPNAKSKIPGRDGRGVKSRNVVNRPGAAVRGKRKAAP